MKKYLVLTGRIRNELDELEKVIERIRKGWQYSNQTGNDLYLDSVALNLHGFYSGIERIFVIIAENIDQSMPGGENWHQALLRQMATEIKLVRPPVISLETRNSLDEFRGFRHVIRNVYTFTIDAGKVGYLVDNLPKVFSRIKTELDLFIQFIEARGREPE